MGVVLKGRDVDLGRDVAVKVLLERHRDNPEMVRRFVEEAQIGGQLQHPGIVPVYELGRLPDGRLYIAMKLVRGRTLAALLEGRADAGRRPAAVPRDLRAGLPDDGLRPRVRGGPPRPEAVERHGGQLRRGPGHGLGPRQGARPGRRRRRGAVARGQADADPVRTLRTGSEADESRAGSVLGTPAYMAPEQARGQLDTLDERADVFGLGAILCEILTGLPPYTGRAATRSTARRRGRTWPRPWPGSTPAAPRPSWSRWPDLAWPAAPRDRPRDAGVVVAALTAYLAGAEQRLREAGLAQARAETLAAGERKQRILAVALCPRRCSPRAAARRRRMGLGEPRAAGTSRGVEHEVNRALDDAARSGSWHARAAGDDRSPLGAGDRGRAVGGVAAAPGRRPHRTARSRATGPGDDGTRARRGRVGGEGPSHHGDAGRVNAEYAAAFRDYGVDLDAIDPAEAGGPAPKSPVAVELANASTSGSSSAGRQHFGTRPGRGDSSRSPRRRIPTPGGTASVTLSTG